MNANQGIMPGSQHIWIQYMDCNLDNTFAGHVPSFSVLYCSYTLQDQTLQFEEHLPAGKTISTISNRCKKTSQLILRPQVQEYVVVISTKYKDPHVWDDWVDRSIWVAKLTDKMHIIPVGAIIRPAHLVEEWENAASDRIDSIWLVRNHVDLDTYWTAYEVTIHESRCAGSR